MLTAVLKNETHLAARVRFKNTAFLTSGPSTSQHNADTNGMKDVDVLVKFVKDLEQIGIFIKI